MTTISETMRGLYFKWSIFQKYLNIHSMTKNYLVTVLENLKTKSKIKAHLLLAIKH